MKAFGTSPGHLYTYGTPARAAADVSLRIGAHLGARLTRPPRWRGRSHRPRSSDGAIWTKRFPLPPRPQRSHPLPPCLESPPAKYLHQTRSKRRRPSIPVNNSYYAAAEFTIEPLGPYGVVGADSIDLIHGGYGPAIHPEEPWVVALPPRGWAAFGVHVADTSV